MPNFHRIEPGDRRAQMRFFRSFTHRHLPRFFRRKSTQKAKVQPTTLVKEEDSRGADSTTVPDLCDENTWPCLFWQRIAAGEVRKSNKLTFLSTESFSSPVDASLSLAALHLIFVLSTLASTTLFCSCTLGGYSVRHSIALMSPLRSVLALFALSIYIPLCFAALYVSIFGLVLCHLVLPSLLILFFVGHKPDRGYNLPCRPVMYHRMARRWYTTIAQHSWDLYRGPILRRACMFTPHFVRRGNSNDHPVL